MEKEEEGWEGINSIRRVGDEYRTLVSITSIPHSFVPRLIMKVPSIPQEVPHEFWAERA
jgi:hypothetical protein